MSDRNKRKDAQQDGNQPKRVKKECSYGENCYRRNPAHFREFCHPHLEAILDTYQGTGPYNIPDKYSMDRVAIEEQLDVIVEKQLYTPWIKGGSSDNTAGGRLSGNRGEGSTSSTSNNRPNTSNAEAEIITIQDDKQNPPLRGILKNVTRDLIFSPPITSIGAQNLPIPQGLQNLSAPQESQISSPTPQGSQNVRTRKRTRNSLSPQSPQQQSSTTTTQGSVTPEGSQIPMTPQMRLYYSKIREKSQNSPSPKKSKKSATPEGSQNLSPSPQGSQTRQGSLDSLTPQKLQQQNLSTTSQEISDAETPEGSQIPMTPQMRLYYSKIREKSQNSPSPKKSKKLATPEGSQNSSPSPQGSLTRQASLDSLTPQKLQQQNLSTTTQEISDAETPEGSQIPMTPQMRLYYSKIREKSQNSPSPKKSKKLTPTKASNLSTPQGLQSPSTSQGSPSTSTPQRSQQSQTTFYPLFNKSPIKQESRVQSNPQGVRNSENGGGSATTSTVDGQSSSRQSSSDYRPIVPPTRRVEDFLNVVVAKGKMADKHAASAPYHLFYTTITAAKETHNQPYSITFQEILDQSLGELKCSLQINFMVELGWLLAQYYFAGYSAKKLTILYGEDSADLQTITQKKPNIDAHKVRMASPFGTHHTKMMILCYEDGSLRVVISTANLYIDDWENRVQGLWFSPKCPELAATAMPHEGDSPTGFKKSLLKYLHHYHLPALTPYIERVKRCNFSHINVFLVASVPGGHFDAEWGLTRVGSLLRQHCAIPAAETKQWPLIAQASSLGSYGKDPNVWLSSDFQHNFCKIKEQPQTLFSPPPLKLIYPSLENVQGSHDGLLGGGCLPYGAATHTKQAWLNDFLYQWRAGSSHRARAMPHIKSYTRTSPENNHAAYFLLTSANCSKAAWGSINKGNAALRIMSYEAGVLFLPSFVINKDLFPLHPKAKNRLVLPYDVPPVKYTSDMSPWVSDYLT